MPIFISLSETHIIDGSKMPYGSLFPIDTTACLSETSGLDLATVNVDYIVERLSTPPRSYQSAACLFRWASRSLTTATDFYTLDEHCLDNIDLVRGRARLYDYLSSFEAETSRKVSTSRIFSHR